MNKKCEKILKELESENKLKVYWNFEFPSKQELKIRLKDILENNVGEKYYINNVQFERMRTTNFLSANLTTMSGGNTEPKILACAAMRGRYDKDGQIQQSLEIQKNETTNAITTVSKDNLIIESSVQPSVAKNFENEKAEILKSDKDIYQAKCTSNFNNNKIGLKVSPTIRSSSSAIYGLTNEMIVRKLTPRECWRLMSFTDEEFDRTAEVNSNSQLYKQAGNSIAVNVLVEIFRNLFPDECRNK